MRAVVTGASGFIGTHLVSALGRNGYAVSGIDNSEPLHHWHGDIRDSNLAERFWGADIIYHLAAEASVLRAESDRDLSFSTNVLGTRQVLEAAAVAGVGRVIFTSSREVYGQARSIPVPESAELRPRNYYGATKAAAEMFCAATRDVEVTVLRLPNIYGPGDRGRVVTEFISAALRSKPLTIFGSGKILDLLWIDDAIDALCRAAVYPVAGKVLNLGSGVPVRLTDLAEQVVRLTGRCSPIQMAARREVEVDSYLADISLASRLLDFAPQTALIAGLERTIARLSQDAAYGCVRMATDAPIAPATFGIGRSE